MRAKILQRPRVYSEQADQLSKKAGHHPNAAFFAAMVSLDRTLLKPLLR
jgi:hypothetical protein